MDKDIWCEDDKNEQWKQKETLEFLFKAHSWLADKSLVQTILWSFFFFSFLAIFTHFYNWAKLWEREWERECVSSLWCSVYHLMMFAPIYLLFTHLHWHEKSKWTFWNYASVCLKIWSDRHLSYNHEQTQSVLTNNEQTFTVLAEKSMSTLGLNNWSNLLWQ